MLIDCENNLTQSDLTDCKIIIIEGGEKVFLVNCRDHCQCFEIQRKLGGLAHYMPKCKNGKVVKSRFKTQGLIRSKCHLDFCRKEFTRGYLEELVTP
jgi:hypothetical protein